MLSQMLVMHFVTRQSRRFRSSDAIWPDQGLFDIGHLLLQRKEGNFIRPSRPCFVVQALRARDKFIWEEKTPVQAVATTSEVLFLVHFFSTLTFAVLDCPQLVWGEYSWLPPPLSIFIHFFKEVTYSTSMLKEKQRLEIHLYFFLSWTFVPDPLGTSVRVKSSTINGEVYYNGYQATAKFCRTQDKVSDCYAHFTQAGDTSLTSLSLPSLQPFHPLFSLYQPCHKYLSIFPELPLIQ